MSTSKLYDSLSGIVQILGALNTKIKELEPKNSYVVTGCSTAAANGTYELDSSKTGYNGSPVYKYGAYYMLYAHGAESGDGWIITNVFPSSFDVDRLWQYSGEASYIASADSTAPYVGSWSSNAVVALNGDSGSSSTADVKDYIQITLPSITAAVKLVLQTSENGTSWTTKINYNSSVSLATFNPSNGNIATVTNSSGFSTSYAGQTVIITPEQIGSPAAGTYYRYQFITGTSADSSKWTVGVLGSSSNGDFKSIQTRLSTLESSSGSSGASVGSTIPANLAATASAGSSSEAARADHVHSTSGLVTINSSSLSSVISVSIVSGSLPNTVSDNVLYFVLGGDSSGEGGSSTQTGPYLEITGIDNASYTDCNGKYYLIDPATANTVNSLWKHESQEYTIGKYEASWDSTRHYQWGIYSTQSDAESGNTLYFGVGGEETISAESNFSTSSPVSYNGSILYHAE